ncbi:MAG: 23S rRNA (adenine(2503)-C(2))-methyltransferase RlmN [Gammaproteobacteria bacterium]|nr:23S rRNA (adenine(2503)-C(2))-methyltransferase RlmN [Gammaproteobacteria bacterium]MCY4227279.1 23S rRNA (adenine(2503)-C(2))-methyltransferase RlmN [Gammaproteobacteria bacterium]
MLPAQNLLCLDRSGLELFFENMGEKPFRARQLLKWVYQRDIQSFSSMTDLGKSLRLLLEDKAQLALPEIISQKASIDGTVKWLIKLHDGNCIETVYIPEPDRGTLCVSSQVGCSLNCSFCATARQGFNRNLDAGEIISQVMLANRVLSAGPELSPNPVHHSRERPVTNIVMMGMGEPLLNLDNVVAAMHLMMDDCSFGLSRRRVTLSTAGHVPGIDALAERCRVSLAVSLHAPNDELRSQLVPLNRKYPIKALLDSCRRYCNSGNRMRVTVEYVMLQGVNDEMKHARQLAALLQDLACKVNLIPFNPYSGIAYERSTPGQIERFSEELRARNIFVVARKTRGDDIEAACGQLAGDFADRTQRSQRVSMQQVALS